VRHSRCVEYKLKYNIKIYNIIIHNFIFLWIILDYNCSYMFRPNCRAIFRLIFEQVECTIDNAFNLRDLVLQELVVSYITTHNYFNQFL